MKELLIDKTYSELLNIVKEFSQPSFRAKQLYDYLLDYKSFDEMLSLPKKFRAELAERYYDKAIEIIKDLHSSDGTIKFLFKLYDGNVIEGVLMNYKYGNTQCVSTQVGCRMNCTFCASGLNGLVRNLTSGEILSELLAVNRFLGGTRTERKITNLVLMGSGEPFDNYLNVISFLKMVNDRDNLNISMRNVSLSTCGLVDKIYKFTDENIPLNLTISLHSPFDDERQQLMPIAKSYSIAQILEACRYYFNKTGRRFILEYVLIKDKNCDKRHADKLIELLKNDTCLVNLIRLNTVEENDYKEVSTKEAYRFMELLKSGGINATLRRQIGSDIDGACGQLRRKYIGDVK